MAAAAAFILGVINFVIRPILLLLAVPLGGAVVFLLGFFANTIALMITANLLPSLQIDSWGWAFLGSLIFSAINLILTNILTIDDENSIYQRLVVPHGAANLLHKKRFNNVMEMRSGAETTVGALSI
ncbi:MAG: hypothetical protein A2Z71_00940 [Chloroflexi bacterium RBG_13_50_21]|nr:MAG: hypothetical protein A2Z71_00940 [Chloroflexi bacterium RBG_13_50_21]OGO65200.1 MAG: hypothetical protein A2030_05525 [Chloroflexi bacterium RBG_19FT_COMBO_50_10]